MYGKFTKENLIKVFILLKVFRCINLKMSFLNEAFQRNLESKYFGR